MTHFGVICPSAPSHLNQFITLGSELKRRGHRVSIINIEEERDRATSAGLEFQAIGPSDFLEESNKKLLAKLSELRGLRGLLYSMNTLGIRAIKMVLRDAPEVIRGAKIEALLVDQASFEGGTVAEYLKIPFVNICNGLLRNQEIGVPPFMTPWNYDPSPIGLIRNRIGYLLLYFLEKSQRELINKYRQQWNLPLLSDLSESYSCLAQLSQQPAELEFPRKELPNCFHFTGPFTPKTSREPIPFPYEKLTGKPLIYASMGTLQNGLLWIFEIIAEACADLDVQLVISCGGKEMSEPLLKSMKNIIVVNYAPQLELLKKAVLAITHGGTNTVMECLGNGVPMVVIPITNDQPGVSARIAWTVTGTVIPLGKVGVGTLRKSITTVLKDDLYKKNALRLQEVIKRSGGVEQAADIIEKVISTGKSLG